MMIQKKYKNNRLYEIDKYYEDKLNNAYSKAKESMENKLIEKFKNGEIDKYIYFNSSINRFIIYNLVLNYYFLIRLEVNVYNIDIIIKLLYENILKINNASSFHKEYEPIIKELEKYLNDDKIKNINYNDSINKEIEELKSVVKKAKEHITKYDK